MNKKCSNFYQPNQSVNIRGFCSVVLDNRVHTHMGSYTKRQLRPTCVPLSLSSARPQNTYANRFETAWSLPEPSHHHHLSVSLGSHRGECREWVQEVCIAFRGSRGCFDGVNRFVLLLQQLVPRTDCDLRAAVYLLEHTCVRCRTPLQP